MKDATFRDILLILFSGLMKQALGWDQKDISNCCIFPTILRRVITQKS